MSTAESYANQADHRAYIETVRVALLLADIHVGVASFTPGRLRSAAMTMLRHDDDIDEPWHYTFTHAERVELRWNEEDGWSLMALHAGDEGPVPTVWRSGFGVVLPPDEIRAWVALLLTMPGASPSQEDGSYRSHQRHDPEFEASLTTYAF